MNEIFLMKLGEVVLKGIVYKIGVKRFFMFFCFGNVFVLCAARVNNIQQHMG